MVNYSSINPFTEKSHHQFHLIGVVKLNEILEEAVQSQQSWKQLSISARGMYLLKLGELIKANHEALATLAVAEMGKPIKEAKAEVLKCVTACEYYGRNSEQLLTTHQSKADTGKDVSIVYEPLGVVLGIFPWNFPYWQIIRSAAPILMAGNAMFIKPAPNTPKCALALQELFHEAGFPKELIHTIFADETQIANLIADERIKACTLTGSEKAGAVVGTQAARFIKRSVLELGGSDPFVVLADADIDKAAETAITARFQNNGQSCIASKRFILHKEIADEFLEKFIHRISELKMGDPMDSDTQIGPMARKDLRDKLKEQLDNSVKLGAKIIYQHPQDMPHGFFFPPTVLTHIAKGTPAYSEELFGPIVSVFIVDDEDEAVRIANDTIFGLGACVWTKDKQRGQRIASQFECGTVFINGLVKSHTAYPFGGAKHSGYGRELGEWGIKEFCNVKTIWE